MTSVRGQSGQLVIEAILILTLLFGITLFTARYLKENEVVASLISRPWQVLSGMLQNGSWSSPASSLVLHPSNHLRHISVRGDEPQ